MINEDDDVEGFDLREDDADDADANRPDVEEIVQHLRDTLTADMAIRAYRIRYERDPGPKELEDFMEELISEHYNAGQDEWSDDYLYYD